MKDPKKLAIYAILISLTSLIISINNYFRFGGINDIKRMIIKMELRLETKQNLEKAIANLWEAGRLGTSENGRDEIKTRLNRAIQLLGIAKITAGQEDKLYISDIKDQLGKINQTQFKKMQSFQSSIDNVIKKIQKIADK
ncbi:MAG: hypothetical protein ABIH39_05480 [Candidatus Margulisiibacteriota bacterium]